MKAFHDHRGMSDTIAGIEPHRMPEISFLAADTDPAAQ